MINLFKCIFTSMVAQMVKVFAYNAGDLGLIPGLGRSPGEGNGKPLQYCCLENPVDGGAWWATVHGVANSRTRLSDFTFPFLFAFPFFSLLFVKRQLRQLFCLFAFLFLGNGFDHCLLYNVMDPCP